MNFFLAFSRIWQGLELIFVTNTISASSPKMPTIEEIQDETVRATRTEKDDDEWDDEESNATVSQIGNSHFPMLTMC